MNVRDRKRKTFGISGNPADAISIHLWFLVETGQRAYRPIPRGRSLLDSSPSVTSSPVGRQRLAGRHLAGLGDRPQAIRFVSVMLMG